MDEKKLVTWEMFKKYHENLVGNIEEQDGLVLDDITDIVSEDEEVSEEE